MGLRHSSALLLLLVAAFREGAALQSGLQGARGARGAGDRPEPGTGGGGGTGGSVGGSSSHRQPEPHQAVRTLLQDPPPDQTPGRAVVLYTFFGPIRIRLLEKLAPRISALVWDLAERRGCTTSYTCSFYRNEARPAVGLGPPYALLQGRMHDLKEDPPYEGVTVEVKRGHVCFIPGGKDWFIAMGDHPEWGKSHPVWGLVDEWYTADLIIQQHYKNWTNPDHGTVLRILSIEVPFVMAAEGDRTYVGPLH